MLRDPGFYRHVPNQFSVHSYLSDRLSSAFENILVNESPFAWLLFYGKWNTQGPWPPHLHEEHFETLRTGLPCIEIVTQSLPVYLEQRSPKEFSKYSLSDISSYTSLKEYDLIWRGLAGAAVTGAVICERQFLVKRDIPQDARPCFRRGRRLEQELGVTDNSIFYTFVVATFEGNSYRAH